jgi:hypothetical protein
VNALRALAFGDLDEGSWGIAWVPEPRSPVSFAVGTQAGATIVSAALHGTDPAGQWRLEGDGVELVLSPSGPPVDSAAQGDGIEGFDQLCAVSGQFTHDGGQRPVECLGWRSERSGRIDAGRLASFRQVSAWFEPDEGLALLALRPRKSRGQESDLIAAAVLGAERPGPVLDPRLSTTYTAGGLPSRAGLELWLQDGSDAAADAERQGAPGGAEHEANGGSGEPDSRQYPHRAAGEALGPYADWNVAEFDLHAELFRWHNRGRDGAGVYLLGQRR